MVQAVVGGVRCVQETDALGLEAVDSAYHVSRVFLQWRTTSAAAGLSAARRWTTPNGTDTTGSVSITTAPSRRA